MKRVNLKQYPKFWHDIVSRMQDHIDASSAISAHHFKMWLSEWYGINVYVMSTSVAGEVYMLESDYIAFALRWA